MKALKQKGYNLLRLSEKYTKTDMVYLARGGFWLGSGQFASALIAFISSLFFANLVSKDIYGNYKFIIAATGILASFSLTGMGSVVAQGVAQGFDGMLKSAVKTTLRYGYIIIVIAVGLSGYYFWNNNITLGFAMLIAGIALPINQAYTLYGNFLVGKKDFKRVTLYGTGSHLLTTTSLVATAVLTQNIIAMIFVYFFISTTTTLAAYYRTTSLFTMNDERDSSLIPYGKHLSVMGLFGTVANQIDKILVFHYLGATNLAVYAFAQAIPDQAKGVLKNIFGVALPKLAILPEDKLRKSIMQKFFQLTAYTTIGVIVYVFSATYIFKILFPKYLDAVLYSQIYMLGLITIPGISLFGSYFQLKKATRKLYELNIITNITTLIITFICIYSFGLIGAAAANGISWLLTLIVYSNSYRKYSPELLIT